MKMIPLGAIVTDVATGAKGMLTHMQVEQDLRQFYCFQPNGLQKQTRQPLPTIWIVRERIKAAPGEVETEIPLAVLGTIVTDDASGFKGTATAITAHISGCLHVQIQPSGLTDQGEIITFADFDLRRCSGKAIPPISISERTKAEKSRPSPMSVQPHRPRMS